MTQQRIDTEPTPRVGGNSGQGADGASADSAGLLWLTNGWERAQSSASIRRVDVKRPDAQVELDDGRIYLGPAGAPVERFVWRAIQDRPIPAPPMAVLFNHRLRELTLPVNRDASVAIIDMSHPDGIRIYRRSLTLLLLAALHRRFPSVDIVVEQSLPFGAYYCTVQNRPAFTSQELAEIEAEMHRIVEEDLPIVASRVPLEKALALFQQSGDESKVKLLAYRRKDDLAIYSLDGVQNYFHGYMVPSSSYLRWFALAKYGRGFLLRFPRRSDPVKLQPIRPSGGLSEVFREYREWMRKMGLRNLGSLNNAITEGRIAEIVLISEALHERRIAEIAGKIVDSWHDRQGEAEGGSEAGQFRNHRIRMVLIAGPSSSGKTTFAKRLEIQLLSNGIRPFALSLDNYFVNRDETPRDENGNYDFESIDALDLDLLNQHLADLLAGKEVTLPYYNFKTGQREMGETVRLGPNEVLIIEGIHGLNPALTQSIPAENTLRIYVSVLAHLNLDRHNRVSTSDVRLLRRIARDHRHRGYTATETINNWASVRRGEEKYIFPYQENADVFFNSALLYELSVLAPVVEPLLLQIERDTSAYIEARRLLAFLQWVRSMDADVVPDNSIIREFIGGSILRRFTLQR